MQRCAIAPPMWSWESGLTPEISDFDSTGMLLP